MFPSCNKLVEKRFQGRKNLLSDPYIRISRNQTLDKNTRYILHTLIQNTKMRQTFIVLASIICTINSFKLGERGTRGAMIGLDKYQCDMLGITHINYSWGNFQFETLTQISNISSANYCRASNGGNQGKNAHSALAGHPGSFW